MHLVTRVSASIVRIPFARPSDFPVTSCSHSTLAPTYNSILALLFAICEMECRRPINREPGSFRWIRWIFQETQGWSVSCVERQRKPRAAYPRGRKLAAKSVKAEGLKLTGHYEMARGIKERLRSLSSSLNSRAALNYVDELRVPTPIRARTDNEFIFVIILRRLNPLTYISRVIRGYSTAKTRHCSKFSGKSCRVTSNDDPLRIVA